MQKEVSVIETDSIFEYEQSINSHLKAGWQILWSNIDTGSRFKYKVMLVMHDAGTVPTKGLKLIVEERMKQLNKWSKDHDKGHKYGELAIAAAALCVYGTDAKIESITNFINHGKDSWALVEKHKEDRIRQLQIAGALIASEIDRVMDKSEQAK